MNTDEHGERLTTEEEAIAETIIWLAQDKIETGEPYQNINSAIHGVMMEINQHIMAYMVEHK